MDKFIISSKKPYIGSKDANEPLMLGNKTTKFLSDLINSLNKLAISNPEINELMKITTKLYEKGYSGIDIMNLLENPKFLESYITVLKRYELLLTFNKVRKEFRNEKLLMLFMLHFIFLSSVLSLENISFM